MMAKPKREIDKELMYKKLMPSNIKSDKNIAQDMDADELEAPDTQSAAETIQQSLNPPQPVTPRDIGLPLMDNQPTTLVNLMEKHVLDKFDSVMARFDCCRCDRCKKDIVAISLNKLPTKYAVVPKGQLTPDVDRQTSTQVLSAMIQAVLQVRTNPRH